MGERDTEENITAIPIPVEQLAAPRATAPTAVNETATVTTDKALAALEAVPEESRPERTIKLRKAPSDQPVTVREIIQGKLNPSRPRPGLLRYLAFDLSIAKFHRSSDEILKEFESAIKNRDFNIYLIEGHLILMATHERANNALQASAKSLEMVCPESKIIIGSAKVKHSGFEDVTFEGITEALTSNQWTKTKPGTYVTEEFDRVLSDPTSRESTLCELILENKNGLGLRKVVKYTPKVSSKLGGPDRLIGNKTELAALVHTLEDEENRLTYVVGPAGIGKTRLLLETLANSKTPYVHCSLDAGDKGYPGHSLVTLASQLTEMFSEDSNNPLKEFVNQPLSDQREHAASAPMELAQKCLTALNELAKLKGENMLFILEDFHNADPHSQPWLKNIALKYIGEEKSSTRKALLTMRPDEIYEFEAQKQLKAEISKFHGPHAFKQIELKPLDLESGIDPETDEALSYQYTYYSLPAELRKGKTLGEWHRALGKASGGIPFQMDVLIADAKSKLQIGERVIELDPDQLETINRIDPKDEHAFAIHYQQRILSLSERSRGILLAVACLDGQISRLNLEMLIRKFLVRERDTTTAMAGIITELLEGGFMVEEKNSKDQVNWRIPNEALTQFVKDSVSAEQGAMYASYIHGLMAYSLEADSGTKFKIMRQIACSPNAQDFEEGFWDGFAEETNKSLDQARENNAGSAAYRMAKSLIEDHGGSKIIITAIQKLQQPPNPDEPETPKSQQKLAIMLLMAIARNALYLGRFKDSEDALEKLQKIQTNHPELIYMTEIALIEYEKAYQKIETRLMGTIYGDDIEKSDKISEAEKAIAKLKLDYRRKDYESLYADYKATETILAAENETHKAKHKGMPSPNYIESQRLVKVMAPYDQWKRSIKTLAEGKVSDDNLDYRADTLTQDQKTALAEIKKELAKIENQKSQFPSILNPYSELYLAAIKAEILAYSGERNEAIDSAAESWRIAEQMRLPQLSARMAQLIANIHIQMGFPELALENLNKRGAISTEKLPKDDFFKWAIRVERLWAIGQIALREVAKAKKGLDEEAQKRQRTKMQELLPQAFEEFLALNQLAAQQKENPIHKMGNGQVAYYVLGYVQWIWRAAQQFGVQKPKGINDESRYPFFSLDTLEQANTYAQTVSGDTLAGEPQKSIRREAWIKRTSIELALKAKRETLARR